ncbi:GntR family transcriptional regulator [Marinobacteraceae bacterium S3BR75-40.1]
MSLTKSAQHSPQPLYVQIKEQLKQRILEGTYAPHDRLPSENELMRTFEVSRITVRQALRDLHSEGLVFSAQGKGTFVSKPKAVQDIRRLEGFGEAMERQGYATSSRLIGIQERRPSQEVRETLELPRGEDVVEVKRVRYLNRTPVSIDLSYFPIAVGRRLFGRDLTGDIFPMLEQKLGIPLGTADIMLEAHPADAETAQWLNIEPGEPVMRVQRLTYNRQDQPIDFEYLLFRGDAYRYRFRVDRKQEPAL